MVDQARHGLQHFAAVDAQVRDDPVAPGVLEVLDQEEGEFADGADGGHAPRPPIGKVGHGQPSFRRVPVVRTRVEVERVGFGHAQAASNALEHLDVVLDRRAHFRLLVEPVEEPPEVDAPVAVVGAGVLQAEPPFSTPTSLHQAAGARVAVACQIQPTAVVKDGRKRRFP